MVFTLDLTSPKQDTHARSLPDCSRFIDFTPSISFDHNAGVFVLLNHSEPWRVALATFPPHRPSIGLHTRTHVQSVASYSRLACVSGDVGGRSWVCWGYPPVG